MLMMKLEDPTAMIVVSAVCVTYPTIRLILEPIYFGTSNSSSLSVELNDEARIGLRVLALLKIVGYKTLHENLSKSKF